MTSKLFTFLIILSALSVVLTVGYITSQQQAAVVREPDRMPPSSPTANRVAGAGIVEASSRNIQIGVSVAGIIAEIPVSPGQKVHKGETLLAVDSRDAEASVTVQQAALEVARRQLAELQQLPRPEDVPIAEASIRSAEALLTQQQNRLSRARKLIGENAMSIDELDAIVEAESVAREQLTSAKAELTKLKAGTWAPQIAIADAQVVQAEAALKQSETALALRTITAPTDGEVLQINVQVGEYVSGISPQSLLVFGDTSQLHVRVDIDEVDIPRFEQAETATGFRRGDAKTAIQLTLLRIEPLVIPKQTLTGETLERTDTRVLQVVFKVNANDSTPKLYVGQQLDVFADTLD